MRLPINLETDRGVILGEGKPENQNHAIIFCHTYVVRSRSLSVAFGSCGSSSSSCVVVHLVLSIFFESWAAGGGRTPCDGGTQDDLGAALLFATVCLQGGCADH